MELLCPGNFTAKVSSTLNRNVQEFGKKFMFDGKNDTCWNSDQGTPQYVLVELTGSPAVVSEVCVQFQGGFVGKDCCLLGGDKIDELHELLRFYPEDTNSLQTFKIPSSGAEQCSCKFFKIVMNASSDFYGRITIYTLSLLGQYSTT